MSPPINAVLRAIEVLRAMNLRPISTLAELHQETGIPKPTLVRLLRTLDHARLVEHGARYGAYRLRPEALELTSGYQGAPAIVEASREAAEATTQDIKWPVAIGVPDADAMIVRYSTIPNSSLSLRHSTLGMRLGLISRALGRAYLAFCGPEERAALVTLASHGTGEDATAARDPEAVERMLNEVRSKGYAIRHPLVRPASSTVAVPIFHGERAVASIGFTWLTSAYPAEIAAARYLERLRRASEDISQKLDDIIGSR